MNPDKNHIDHMDRELRRTVNPPTNLEELDTVLINIWQAIALVDVNRLRDSMRRRVTDLIFTLMVAHALLTSIQHELATSMNVCND